jgi:cytidine deaminase
MQQKAGDCYMNQAGKFVSVPPGERSQLIEAAQAVCGDFQLRDNFSAGGVAAAIRTVNGNIYTGVCIDLGCGLGFCAEVAAIADMLKHRETHIAAVVAVSGGEILPPCGRCRETMAQVDARNLNCRVIVSEEVDVSLRELLPRHWLNANGITRAVKHQP